MPNKEKTENLYYSYDINNVHFVSLNSEIPYEKFTEDYKLAFQNWLDKDLSSTIKKWKVAYLHRPLYCSMEGDNCDNSAKNMRKLIEEILQKNKVDLVLTGHVHAYERMFPIYNEIVDNESLKNNKNTYFNPKYPAHIICGAGGNKEGFEDCKYFYFFLFFIFIDPVSDNISKIMIGKPGICLIDFEDDKMTHSFINSETKEIMDSFEIIKNR